MTPPEGLDPTTPPQGEGQGWGAVGDLADALAGWDRAGLASGHAWSACDACGVLALLSRAGGRRCFLTHRCPGRHRPPAGRPTPLQAVKLGLVSLDDIRRHPPELGPTLRRLLEADDRRRSSAPFGHPD